MLQYFQNAQIGSLIPKYSAYEFIFRLKKIEKIGTKEGVDGVLIINGIDSRENIEYIKLTNWLFLGMNGLEILENEYLNSIYGEMIVLITKNKTYLFIEPEGLEQLKELIYSIPKVEIFCPTQEQFENKDELEIIKMSFFYKIMRGIKKVGVMLGKKDSGKIMKIEKWPLLQGYGLQEIGVGFFSMNHNPVDLTTRINAAMKNHDKASLQKLIMDTSKRMVGHMNGAAGTIGDVKIHKRQLITEQQVNELMNTAYELEELSKFINDQNENKLPKPRVLFGKNTGASYNVESSQLTIKDCWYSEEMPCFHMTLECCDLHTKLRTARTYFLKKNVLIEKHVVSILNDENVQVELQLQPDENKYFKDEEFLVNLYLGLVVAFQDFMQLITKDYRNLTEDMAIQTVHAKMEKIYQKFTLPGLDKKYINAHLKCYNAFGEEGKIDFKDTISFKLTPVIYMLRLELSNIKSIIKQDIKLGSIIFCESFILQEGCYLLLTRDISFLDFWNCDSFYSDKIMNMKKYLSLPEIGIQLTAFNKVYPNNRIFIPSEKLSNYGFDIPVITGSYIFHEKGMRIGDDKIGWILIAYDEMKNIHIIKNLNHTWLAFLLNENIVMSSLSRDMLCLEFQGLAMDEGFFKIREYFDTNQIKYQYIEGIPPFFSDSQLARRIILNQPQNQNIKLNMIQNEQFLLQYLESKQLMILNNLKDLKLTQFKLMQDEIKQNTEEKNFNYKVGVIFVNGPFCSGKRKFAENLIKFGPENDLKLYLIKYQNQQIINMDEKTFLQNLLQFIEYNKVQPGQVIISAVPFTVNMKIVLEMIEKSQTIDQQLFIRTIVTKVNVNNFFKNQNKNLTEQAFSLCIDGYCQVIVQDSYNNFEKDVDDLNKMLRTMLPNTNIIKVQNNILYGGQAKDILTQNLGLSQNYQLKFIPFKIPVQYVKLRDFIFKEIMQKRQGYFFNDQKLAKDIDQYKQQFEKSKDPLAIELLNLKEKIERINLEILPSTPKVDYIQAIVRLENKIQDGFYEITINQNYFKEKQIKNIKVRIVEEKKNNQVFQKAYYQGIDNVNDIGFFFAGENLQEDILYSFLIRLTQEMKPLFQYKSKEMLSIEEIKAIELQYREYGLDNGVFYDGYCFRDGDGLALPQHPKINEIIAMHLNQVNKEIEQKNNLIENERKAYETAYQEILLDNPNKKK